MTNVIRPTFGRTANAKPQVAGPNAVEEFSPLRVYGTAVNHFVALIRGMTRGEGPTLRVIVGRVGGKGAETVAIFPDDEDSEADAEAAAFAILRSLEIANEATAGTK